MHELELKCKQLFKETEDPFAVASELKNSQLDFIEAVKLIWKTCGLTLEEAGAVLEKSWNFPFLEGEALSEFALDVFFDQEIYEMYLEDEKKQEEL